MSASETIIKTDTTPKADLDSSSMRGFVSEFPPAKPAERAYDIDSSSMRGFAPGATAPVLVKNN